MSWKGRKESGCPPESLPPSGLSACLLKLEAWTHHLTLSQPGTKKGTILAGCRNNALTARLVSGMVFRFLEVHFSCFWAMSGCTNPKSTLCDSYWRTCLLFAAESKFLEDRLQASFSSGLPKDLAWCAARQMFFGKRMDLWKQTMG